MKRTNPVKGRGIDPKFVPVSWDEALNTVADKLIELRNAGEPHKLTYMRGRYSPTSTELLYGTLPKVFGTPNYFSHSAICAEAEKMGPGLTQGFFGYRDYDLEKTNCLVLWGTDPLASNRMVPNMMRRFHEIVARGTVIAIDPRLSNVGAKAHEWLPVNPGTDGALAGAMAHVLLTEGMWNKEFVGDFKDGRNLFVAGKLVDEAAFAEKETYGLVKWWNLELKDHTPAWGEKESLIPAAQIVRVARAMGKAAPKTVVWMGPGVAMSPRGTYAAMAVYALNGLLGSVDVEGGVWQSASSPPLAGFPKMDAYVDEVAKKGGSNKKLDGRGAKDMPAMMGGKPGRGDAPITGWAEFKKKGMFHGPRYTLKKGWGGKFATVSKKFEFYSETLKKGLLEHAKKFETTPDDILAVSGYLARGEVAFVPHYEAPKRHGSVQDYPLTFIDYKSRLNREGRSQNLTWYQEFKKVDPGDVSWNDVVKMNPVDGAKLGLKTGDMVKISSPAGAITTELKLWEGVSMQQRHRRGEGEERRRGREQDDARDAAGVRAEALGQQRDVAGRWQRRHQHHHREREAIQRQAHRDGEAARAPHHHRMRHQLEHRDGHVVAPWHRLVVFERGDVLRAP